MKILEKEDVRDGTDKIDYSIIEYILQSFHGNNRGIRGGRHTIATRTSAIGEQ